MQSDVYFTPREAAGYLKTSVSTLAKRRLYGGGPEYYRLGRAIRYLKSDLDDFMLRSRAESSGTSDSGGDHA
jgi:excisionase family DNA binding protein